MTRTAMILLTGTLLFVALPGQAQQRHKQPEVIHSNVKKTEVDPKTLVDTVDMSNLAEWLPIEQERFISAILSFDQIGIQRGYLRKPDMVNMRRLGMPLVMCAAFSEPETGNFGNSQECSIEREATVRLLLHLGADVNAREETGKDPKTGKPLYGDNLLIHALKAGNPFVIKIALDNAKIDAKSIDANGETPLHLAVNPVHKTIHHAFEDSVVVESYTEDREGNVVTEKAEQVKRTFRIDELIASLVKRGAEIEARNAAGETPLLVVLKAMQKMETLETQPVNPQSRITYGAAYSQSRINLLLATRSLLLAGASITVPDIQKNTPLSIAKTLKKDNLVRRMLEAAEAGHRPTEAAVAAPAKPAVVHTVPKPVPPVKRPEPPPVKVPERAAGDQPPPVKVDRPWQKNKDAPNIIDMR